MSERVRVKGGGLYTKVVDRLTAFKEKYHPDHGYSIITNIESLTDNYVVFKAEIIAFTGDGTDKDKIVVATGHGFNAIAKEKSLEKAETVAVGRALAFFDPKFGGESELASQEEMDKFREMTKDDGSFNPPTQPKEQPKYNKDFVDKMEKNEPFLNGQRDKAMEQMNGGSNGNGDLKDSVCNFKKYKGMQWSEVALINTVDDEGKPEIGTDYMKWIKTNVKDLDTNTLEILNQYVG